MDSVLLIKEVMSQERYAFALISKIIILLNFIPLDLCGNYACIFFFLCFYVSYKYSKLNLNKFGEWRFIGLTIFTLNFKIVIGVLTGLDQSLSNISYKYVTVVVYSIVKSMVPGFVMIFSFLFGLEKPNCLLVSSISLLIVGIIVTAFKSVGLESDENSENESKFYLFGIFLVIVSSVAQACRFVFSQIVMQKRPKNVVEEDEMSKITGILILFFSTPYSLVTVLLIATITDIPKIFSNITNYSDEWYFYFISLNFFMGLLSIILTISINLILQHTSSLTLTVSGKIRSVCLVIITFVFMKQFNLVVLVGYLIVSFGVVLFNIERARKRSRRNESDQREAALVFSLSTDSLEDEIFLGIDEEPDLEKELELE